MAFFLKKSFPKPRITFDRVGQIVFTLKEVIKLTFKINPGLLTSILVLNSLWGISSVPLFYIEKLILDKLIEAIGNPDWIPVVRIILILVLIRFVIEYLRNFASSFIGFLRFSLSRSFSAELEVLMGRKMSELDLSIIEDPEFRDRFNKVERESGRRSWGLMMPLSDIPNYLFGFLSSVGLLILLAPWIAVGILVLSLPGFFISSRFIKKDYQLNTSLSPLYRIWGWISYYLIQNKNFMELKILNLSDYLSTRMRGIQKEVLEKHIDLEKKRTIAEHIGFIPISIFDLVILVWIVFLTISGKITIGSFQMYTRALVNAQQNLSGLVNSFLEIYENYIYVSDLVWFLGLNPVIESSVLEGRVKLTRAPHITFDNVWFKYRQESPWVLRGVDLNISPGEKIALVGNNGVGKSTLIKLIGRFYDPQKGKITLDGKDISEVNLRSWRDNLAVLFQDFEVYPFSAREAIGYGDIKRTNDLGAIKKAAARSGIDRYIEGLPLRYNNPVTPEFDKGVRPSIGQWQRFGIARMLFRKDANVLILDEPTSNVDPEAEEKIFNELKKITADKILIFVTQRFSTVRIADRILVMDNGKIVEEGSHKELIELAGKYAKLYNLQAQAYNNPI